MFIELVLVVISLFLVVASGGLRNTVSDNDNNNGHTHTNDITKCNDLPYPSAPLRTLTSLGICGTHDYMNSPHDLINCKSNKHYYS